MSNEHHKKFRSIKQMTLRDLISIDNSSSLGWSAQIIFQEAIISHYGYRLSIATGQVWVFTKDGKVAYQHGVGFTGL